MIHSCMINPSPVIFRLLPIEYPASLGCVMEGSISVRKSTVKSKMNREVYQAAITSLNTGIQANQWQQSIILLFFQIPFLWQVFYFYSTKKITKKKKGKKRRLVWGFPDVGCIIQQYVREKLHVSEKNKIKKTWYMCYVLACVYVWSHVCV